MVKKFGKKYYLFVLKNLVKKLLGQKKFLAQEKSWGKKNLGKKDLGQKKICLKLQVGLSPFIRLIQD